MLMNWMMIFHSVKLIQMNRILIIIIAILISSFSFAQNNKYTKLVNDFADILTEREEQALERKLVTYDDSTSTQIAVVTINSLNGKDIASYSFELGDKMGIGRKDKNNGVLLLIAMQERKMYIATGYGMEGIVPDALAKRIIENYLKPNFRNKTYYKGIDEATSVIIGLAEGEYTADQLASKTKNYSGLLFPLLFIVIFMISSLSKYRHAKSKHLAGSDLSFLAFMLLMSNSRGHSSGSGFGSFSSGGGSFGGGGGFGGFGGGSFGGGGAGGGW